MECGAWIAVKAQQFGAAACAWMRQTDPQLLFPDRLPVTFSTSKNDARYRLTIDSLSERRAMRSRQRAAQLHNVFMQANLLILRLMTLTLRHHGLLSSFSPHTDTASQRVFAAKKARKMTSEKHSPCVYLFFRIFAELPFCWSDLLPTKPTDAAAASNRFNLSPSDLPHPLTTQWICLARHPYHRYYHHLDFLCPLFLDHTHPA